MIDPIDDACGGHWDGWERLADASAAHAAAFAAWRHAATGCTLVRWWMTAEGDAGAGAGCWCFHVLHPLGARHGQVCVGTAAADETIDPRLLIDSASEAAETMESRLKE